MRITLLLVVTIAAVSIFNACKKSFLEQETIGILTEAEAQSAKGARQFLVGTYAALKGTGWEGGGSNWVYGSISGGDANKGSDAGDQAEVVIFGPIQSSGFASRRRTCLSKGRPIDDAAVSILSCLL